MTTTSMMPEPRQRYYNNDGSLAAGCYLYTYAAGTSTPKATYTDYAGTIPHANPIVLDSKGEALIYWDGSYKVDLKTAAGVQITGYPVDNYVSSDGLADTLRTDLAASSGASLVSWIRAATGAVAYTLGVWLGWQKPNALEFMTTAQRVDVLARTLTLDVTVPLQTAITAATLEDRVLQMPGAYLVTDTLLLPNQTQLSGEHQHMGFEGGTIIDFRPTSLKNLFEPTGLPATLKDGYCIENLYIKGNSTNATGYSGEAIHCVDITKSTFKNLRIQGFRTGIRCEATINNRFEFCHINDNYVQNIYYTGDTATTDVWDQCYIANAPVGVQTDGYSLSIKFLNCIFESLNYYGIDLVKECYGWQVINCYGEDTPNDATASNCVFRVGFAGTTLAASPQLQVLGGTYVGRQAGAVGSVLSVDYTDGVMFGDGLHATGFTSVIKTSANTTTNQVLALGFTCAGISSVLTDDTKVSGLYPRGAFNSGYKNQQVIRAAGDVYLGAATACTGAITTSLAWNITKVGEIVTLLLPPTTGTATATPWFKYGELIPTKYRPSSSLAFPCVIQDNGATVAGPGMIVIAASTGAIAVYKDAVGSNYTNAAASGLGQGCGTSLSWTV